MSPSISILLPVYDGERFLGECLDSVLRQSHENFELLVGNDASGDLSGRIADRFSGDPRVRIFHRRVRMGLFANVNCLVEAARSPLIRFLCQDDVLEAECLAEETRFFREHPSVGMSYNKHTLIGANGGGVLGKGVLHDLPSVVPPHLSNQLFFYYGCLPGNLSTVCVRRRCFDHFGRFNPDFTVAGDYEMWVRICANEELGVIHKHLVRLRTHTGQLSRAPWTGPAFIQQNRKIRDTLISRLSPEVRKRARNYELLRQGVLDVHYCIRCLLRGQFGLAAQAFSFIGVKDFLIGALGWLLSFNNHLWKPQPLFSAETRPFDDILKENDSKRGCGSIV